MNELKQQAEQLEIELRAELPEFGIWVDWDYYPPDGEFGLQVYFDIKIKREIDGVVSVASMQVLNGDDGEPALSVAAIAQAIREKWKSS